MAILASDQRLRKHSRWMLNKETTKRFSFEPWPTVRGWYWREGRWVLLVLLYKLSKLNHVQLWEDKEMSPTVCTLGLSLSISLLEGTKSPGLAAVQRTLNSVAHRRHCRTSFPINFHSSGSAGSSLAHHRCNVVHPTALLYGRSISTQSILMSVHDCFLSFVLCLYNTSLFLFFPAPFKSVGFVSLFVVSVAILSGSPWGCKGLETTFRCQSVCYCGPKS